MSKFKIGDKVHVKYIPGVTDNQKHKTFKRYPCFEGEQEIAWLSGDGLFDLVNDPDGWLFVEDSLEFATSQPQQRTLLGLETEYKVLHDRATETLHQMNLVGLEIQKLKELEE